MTKRVYLRVFTSLLLLLLLGGVSPAKAQVIDDVAPGPNEIGVSAIAPVEVVLPPGVNPDDVTLRVFGNRAGLYNGDLDFDPDARTLSFQPDCPLHPDEVVSASVGGGGLASTFSWQFTVDAPFGNAQFEEEVYELSEEEENGLILPSLSGDELPEASVFFPPGIYAADLDGTLLSDAVVVNRSEGTLDVLFNDGSGFTRLTIENVDRATNVISADVTGSGFPDLIANDAIGNTITVVHNNASARGDRDFGDAFVIDTGSRPAKVAAADVTGNGHQDLVVVAFSSDEVHVHPNDGSGEFVETPDVYEVGSSPTDLAIRDFNNDGAPDIAVLSQGDDEVSVLVNDGSGEFSVASPVEIPFAGSAIQANDIVGTDGGEAGNGWIDILVASQDEGQVAVFPNLQDGGTPAFDAEILYETFSNDPPFDAIVADIGFADDNTLDLLTTHPFADGEEVRWQLNENNSDFQPPSNSVLQSEIGPTAMDAADFSRDLSLDVVLTNSTGDKVSVLENLTTFSPLVCDPDEVLAFGSVCIGEDEELILEVSNRGTLPLDVSLEVLGPDASAFEPDSDLTEFSLNPQELVEVPITFSPTEGRDYAAELEVVATEDNQICTISEQRVYIKEIDLEGTGIDEVLTADPDPLIFEETVAGETRTETFVLTNDGNSAVEIEDFDIDGAPTFAVLTPPDFSLSPGASADIDVQFEPEEAGSYSATLIVETLGSCSEEPLMVELEGEAVPPLPDLSVESLTAIPALDDPVVGDAFDFEAVLENRFADVDDTFVNRFEITRPDGSTDEAGSFTLDGIAEGETRTFESDVVNIMGAGDHQMCFAADINDDVEERTTENNEECVEFSAREPLPDLVANSLELSDPEESLNDVLVTQNRTFTCDFSNDGEIGAGEFTIAIERDGDEVGSLRVDELEAGGSDELTTTVQFPSSGLITVECIVDVDGEVEEVTEDNNRIAVDVRVEEAEEILVSPNPFTPNGDGFDDEVIFRVSEAGLSSPSIRIFSFEGREIFSSSELSGGDLFWDGTDNSGNAQRPGVYIYVIRDNNQTVESGHVTLAR